MEITLAPSPRSTHPPISKVTLVAIGASIIVLSAIMALTLTKIERDVLAKTGVALHTVLQTSHQAFHSWAGQIKRQSLVWARVPTVREATEELLNIERTPEALIHSDAQRRIRDFLNPVHKGKGYRGFFIIAPDGISLASTRDANTGVRNLLTDQPDFLRRVLSGETAISLPQQSDVPLPDASGRLREGQPTMFVGAPVRDDTGKVIAIMTFRVPPSEDFTAIFQRGRLGESGETYAFNRDGKLISESRFDSQLRDIGLIAPDQRGILHISLRDPGVNLVKGERPRFSTDLQPFTLMAKSVISGHSGMNLQGYRDYRGVDVVGAWLWGKQYGFGITTEIDTEEIYRDLRTTQFIFIGFAVLSIVAFVVLAATFEFHRRRIWRAQEALRESEARFRTLAENAPVGIFEADAAGNCNYVNERWCEIAGLTEPDALGNGWIEALHPDDRKNMLAERSAKASKKMPFSLEYRMLRPNGQISWVVGQAAAKTGEEGQEASYVGTITDITEHRHLEERLLQAQKIKALGDLAGGIAHDFNNTLFPIITITEIVMHDLPEASEARVNLEKVVMAARRGRDLVRKILTYSRQEPASLELVNLRDMIDEVTGLLRATLPATIEIRSRHEDGVGPVLADATQIHEVLINLGTNAAFAIGDKIGKIEIDLEFVELDEKGGGRMPGLTRGRYARLTVRDTGCGMDEETIARIFDPYFTTKPVTEGTGLGLAAVQGIIASHNGAVEVSSAPGQGAVFMIYLPLMSEEDPADVGKELAMAED